jgi:hypothetical protein
LTKLLGLSVPYKLSPSMTTNPNGNWWRDAISFWATARCLLSPVPVSPMTANRSEPSFIGSFSVIPCAKGVVTNANRNNETSNRCITTSPCY